MFADGRVVSPPPEAHAAEVGEEDGGVPDKSGNWRGVIPPSAELAEPVSRVGRILREVAAIGRSAVARMGVSQMQGQGSESRIAPPESQTAPGRLSNDTPVGLVLLVAEEIWQISCNSSSLHA